MNFDRKFNADNGKASQSGSNPAEFSPVFDNKAQDGFVNLGTAEHYRNGTDGQYPSGAFPALNVAYPNAGIPENGQIIAGGSGDFVSHENSPADMSGGYSPDYGGEDYRGQPYRPQLSDDGPGSSAWSNAEMADENYRRNLHDRQDAHGQPLNYADEYNGNQLAAPHGDQNPAYGQESDALARDSFVNDGFRGGLSGELDIQPAHFNPADYDYNYNPDGYDDMSGQNRNPGIPARQEHNYADSGALYQEQEEVYAQPEHGDSYHSGEIRDDYQSANLQSGQGGAEVSHGGGYNLQNRAYADDQASYAAADNIRNYDSHYYGQGQGETGGYAGSGQNQGYNQSYAETGNGYTGGLYASAEQANEPISADFARLDADVSQMDQAAARAPMQAEESSGSVSDEHGYSAAGGGQSEWPVSDADYPPIQDGLVKDADSYPVSDDPQREANSAPDAVSSDAAYDDDVYEWEEPPAPVSRPQAVKEERRGRSKGALLFVTFLILIGLAGAGIYLKFGSSSLGGSGDSVTIHNTAGGYKIKGTNPQAAAGSQEQSVTDGVGNNASQAQQKALVDKTESPVEVQKMDDRLPVAGDNKPFDQSAVDSMVQTVVAQAAPVHIVPSVKVDADHKVVASSADGEKVLAPGSDMADANVSADSFAQEDGAETHSRFAPLIKSDGSAAAPAAAVAPPPVVRKAEETPAKSAKTAKTAAPELKQQKEKVKSAASSGGGFYMQISSQPSKEAAEQSMRAAKKRLSADVAGKVAVVPAAIPRKGTYYRVRVSAGSREDAVQMCDAYKKAGGSCFISK